MALKLVRIDGEDPPEARDVRTRLDLWNVARTGIADWAPMTIVLRDEDGAVRGGVLGSTWAGGLHVTILWVDEALRGRGHGRRLLEAAEAFGREHGCTHAKLDTFTFQAGPRFYEHLGWTVFGVIDDHPPGHRHYFLRKSLYL